MRPLTLLPVIATLLVLGASHAYANTPQCNTDRDGIRYESKIEVCNKIIKNNPKDAQAYYHRGVLYWTLGLSLNDKNESASISFYDRAIADLRKTIALLPKNPDSHSYLASAHRSKYDLTKDQRDFSNVLVTYNKAMKVFPGDARWYFYRGAAYQVIRDYDRAIADYTTTIELDPAHSAAYNLRGELYKALGDNERGQADHDKYLELTEDDECFDWC